MRIRSTVLIVALFATAPALAQNIVPKTMTVTTSKGDFEVPGRAFLDGSDPESRPPVIAKLVSLFQSATTTHVVCQVEHGTEVNLLEVQRHVEKKLFYFRVKAPACEGWVPATALSTKKVPRAATAP